MPESTTDSSSCIVGAGPAGLLLALLLGRAGHRVTVLERSPRIEPPQGDGGPVLQPGTLQILDQLGLLERLRAGAGEIRHGAVNVRGVRVADFAYADIAQCPLPFAMTVSVGTLRHALLEALKEYPGVELLLGTSVTALEEMADGRLALTVTTASGESRTLRPGFVVGCDGKFSTVRELAAIPTEVFAYDKGYLDFSVPMPEGWGERMVMHFHDGDYVMATPFPGGRLLVVWITAEERVAAAMGAGFGELAERLVALAPELAAAFTPEVRARDWAQLSYRHVQHHLVRPQRWLERNVVLVGDSAHGLHAFGGQGLNSALQDTVWVADGIDHALAHGGSTERLAQYIRVRKPFIEQFQEVQRARVSRLSAPARDGAGAGQGEDESMPDFLSMALGQRELRPLWSTLTQAAR